MLRFDLYHEALAFYYEQISQSAYHFDGREFARYYDAAYATAGSWLRDLALPIQDFARGQRVIEIAAGHGRWTRYIAEVAQHVLATDTSPGMLDQARELVSAGPGRDIPDDRCAFRELDAFELDRITDKFDRAVSVNFFQHVPFSRHGEFLDALAAALGPGGQVLIAINRLRRGTRSRFYHKHGEPDSFDMRRLSDGSVYEIIDNVFTEPTLRSIFDHRAKNFRYTCGASFYWVTYDVR